MKAFERRDWIVTELYRSKKVHVAALAQRFGVSEETIRRDLDKLEKDGVAKKNYGGAVLGARTAEDPPYASRHYANIEAKRAIAARTLGLVEDGDSIMTDTSSTAFEALRLLVEEKKGLTIITNSLVALSEFQRSGHKLIATGGTLGPETSSLVGPDAERTVSKYNVDVLLFSCKALSMAGGICDSNEAESDLKEKMRRQANKAVLLADHSKFDRIALIKLFGFGEVDYIVSDKRPSDEWTAFLEQQGVSLLH